MAGLQIQARTAESGGYDALAAAAVAITRKMATSEVIAEIAAQAVALTGASASRVEVSRDHVDRAPLRATSGDYATSTERSADLVVEMTSDDGTRLGFVEVWYAAKPDSYDARHRPFLEHIAHIGAASVANARLRAAERRTRTNAARLLELTAALSEAVSFPEVTHAVVQHLIGAFDADGAVVTRCSDDGQELEIVDSEQMEESTRAEWIRFPVSADVPLAEVARTGNAVFLESRDAWLTRYPHLRDVLDASGHHANAILPLTARNKLIGSMGIAFRNPRTFDPEDRGLAVLIARQCALALDRARLYESELAARQRAETANTAKSEFLAVMSHELRTPLNAISGYAELMMIGIHGPLTPAQKDDLDRIQRSQRHLLTLINNLLDYAKIESGKATFTREPVKVLDTIRSAVELVAPQVRAKQLDGRITVDPGLSVHGDAEKIEQIIVNLLANASKFTPRGGVIEVTARLDGDTVRIDIADSGVGVPADMHERIFEPFVQLNSPVTSHVGGTGLGLAISRDLARLMDGALSVAARDGGGSIFTITLPAVSSTHGPVAEVATIPF